VRVLVQQWEESEVGWGTRPDGYSIHETEQDREDYIKEYWDRMPNYIPSEYSDTCGNPFWYALTDKEMQDLLNSSKNGIREYNWKPWKD